MEQDDKLLKELLKEGFLTKAPDSFTENVMHAVDKLETEKKAVFDFSSLGYLSILLAALMVSMGAFYFFDHSSFYTIQEYTLAFFGSMLSPFMKIFGSVSSWELNYSASSLIIGTLLIIGVLLVFDSMVLGKKRYMNLFV